MRADVFVVRHVVEGQGGPPHPGVAVDDGNFAEVAGTRDGVELLVDGCLTASRAQS